jgi:hypothetical protein
MKLKKLYVPRNLPTIPKDIAPACHYILHRIWVGKALWQTVDGHVSLSSILLKRITRDYKKAITYLIDNNIISKSPIGYSTETHTCNSYRWNIPYYPSHRIDATETITKAMERYSRGTFRAYTKTHKYLFKWLSKLVPDSDSASLFLNTFEPEDNDLSREEYIATVRQTFQMIKNGDYNENVCSYGRVHSTVTRLLDQLRAFLTIDGQYLVNVDIVNSQPLILACSR